MDLGVHRGGSGDEDEMDGSSLTHQDQRGLQMTNRLKGVSYRSDERPQAHRAVGVLKRSSGLAPLTLFLATLFGAPAHAVNCDDVFANAYVSSFESVTPIPFGNEINGIIDDYEKARCHQDKVISLFEQSGRKVIGYKVAASSLKGQQDVGAPGPIPGKLFDGMMLPDGARIKRSSGVFLIYEADMLVRVGNDDIMNARTTMDVLRSLDSVMPFIEVGDAMLGKDVKFTGTLLYAMNAGSRWGVAGEQIEVQANEEFLDALAGLRVTLKGKDSEILTQAKGSAILDHPLNSVLFIVEEARRRGWKVQKGHLLSLGSLGRFQVVKPGREGHLSYEGLPGGPATVSVYFD